MCVIDSLVPHDVIVTNNVYNENRWSSTLFGGGGGYLLEGNLFLAFIYHSERLV